MNVAGCKETTLTIKAIVFDYGQVISLPQDPVTIDRLAERAGVERDKFGAMLWSLRGEWDRGTINGGEYYREILSRLSVSVDDRTINDMVEMDLASWKNINAGTVALAEEIKKAGYTLGILSNMPHEFLNWARKNNPVFPLFDMGLFSCEVNLLKPEKAIYEKLISLTGAEAGELVFFDDNHENVSSARELGINAFLWKDPGSARRELLTLGLRL